MRSMALRETDLALLPANSGQLHRRFHECLVKRVTCCIKLRAQWGAKGCDSTIASKLTCSPSATSCCAISYAKIPVAECPLKKYGPFGCMLRISSTYEV